MNMSTNHIIGVVVSVLASSAVDLVFESWLLASSAVDLGFESWLGIKTIKLVFLFRSECSINELKQRLVDSETDALTCGLLFQ